MHGSLKSGGILSLMRFEREVLSGDSRGGMSQSEPGWNRRGVS